ncbi:GlxA family transcriptional regulator [Acidicapsa ligni]|uniref:GlxA family transcriptional regulator n=1 Tax=Acidicapsa ligni TaxID=542300 RepID=UPI0021E0E4D3|nr:helix-turn-helix domain-containing protein [Acidicapsa ligni]
MRRIVITGPAPVQILDVTGPLEVFGSAPGYEVVLATPENDGVLRTHRGVSLTGAVPLSALADTTIDTLMIAGGLGAESGIYDEGYLQWIADAAGRSRRVASICTGAFLLAAAGLLDGRQAVTHWAFCDRLAREFPKVEVLRDPIYLRDMARDGDGHGGGVPIYTSAGITAGIDLSLAMVEEDHGHAVALEVARMLVMFLVRPGGQAQFSHMLSHQAGDSLPLRELQVWMLEHLRDHLTVELLAERIGMSARHFTRVCLRETGMNPGQFVDRMRVEAAQRMMDSSAMGLKGIADACGFQSADSMRRTFLREIGVTAGEYARRFTRREIQSTD